MATGRENYVWWEKKTEQRDFKYWRRAVKTEAGRQSMLARAVIPVVGQRSVIYWAWTLHGDSMWKKWGRQTRGQRIMGNVSEGMKEGIRKQLWLAYLSVWKCRDLQADPLSKTNVRHHHETLYIRLNARNNSRSGSALTRPLTVLGLCRLWLHLS